MRWILDDGPFGHLAKTIDLGDIGDWQGGILLVAGTTAASATPTSQALLDARVGNQALVGSFEIRIGSGDLAEQVLAALHPDAVSTADLAEHESIAWAQVHGPDAVFVCMDRRATLTALAELGRGRVAHPFDTWLDLRQRGWLSARVFKRLCRLTRNQDRGLPRMPERVDKILRRDSAEG